MVLHNIFDLMNVEDTNHKVAIGIQAETPMMPHPYIQDIVSFVTVAQ